MYKLINLFNIRLFFLAVNKIKLAVGFYIWLLFDVP